MLDVVCINLLLTVSVDFSFIFLTTIHLSFPDSPLNLVIPYSYTLVRIVWAQLVPTISSFTSARIHILLCQGGPSRTCLCLNLDRPRLTCSACHCADTAPATNLALSATFLLLVHQLWHHDLRLDRRDMSLFMSLCVLWCVPFSFLEAQRDKRKVHPPELVKLVGKAVFREALKVVE